MSKRTVITDAFFTLVIKKFINLLQKATDSKRTQDRGSPKKFVKPALLTKGGEVGSQALNENEQKLKNSVQVAMRQTPQTTQTKEEYATLIAGLMDDMNQLNGILTESGLERRKQRRQRQQPEPEEEEEDEEEPQQTPKKKKKKKKKKRTAQEEEQEQEQGEVPIQEQGEVPIQEQGESDRDYYNRLVGIYNDLPEGDPIISEYDRIFDILNERLDREDAEEEQPQKTQLQKVRESLGEAGISELKQPTREQLREAVMTGQPEVLDEKTATFGDEEPITLNVNYWERLARYAKGAEDNSLSSRMRSANKNSLNTEIKNIAESSQRNINRNDILDALRQYIERDEGLPLTRQKVITTRKGRVKAQTQIGALLSNQEEVIDRLEQAGQNRTANELQRQVNNTRLETNIIDNTKQNTDRILEAIREEARQTLIEINKGLTQQEEIINKRIDDININTNDKKALKKNVDRLKRKLQTRTRKRLISIEENKNLSVEQKRQAIKEVGNFNIPKVNDTNRRRIIQAMPENMRTVFGDSVNNLLLGRALNINNIISSVIGLGAGIAFTPAIAPAVSTGVNDLLDAFDINIDEYVYGPRQPTSIEGKEEPIPIGNVSQVPEDLMIQEAKFLSDSNVTEGSSDEERMNVIATMLARPENKTDPVAQEIASAIDSSMLRVPLQVARPVRGRTSPSLPFEPQARLAFGRRQRTRQQLIDQQGRRGAIAGAVGAGAMALATGQGAGGAIGVAGMGALAGGSLATAIEAYLRQRNVPLETRRGQRLYRVMSEMPAKYLAGILGVSIGALTAGAMQVGRINETPIEVSQDIVDQTTAELQQVAGQKNKQWAKRIIQPSTNIMDKSRQEQYADDVEFALFDYVPPTEQGNGTVKSNPLVRNQFVNHQIQMEDAGVNIPTVLFNTLVDASSLTDRQMDALFRGAPPLIRDPSFVKYNGDDFDNVAKYQYPNKENTEIGMLDPYRFFSRVDNHWSYTPDSQLFTINP